MVKLGSAISAVTVLPFSPLKCFQKHILALHLTVRQDRLLPASYHIDSAIGSHYVKPPAGVFLNERVYHSSFPLFSLAM